MGRSWTILVCLGFVMLTIIACLGYLLLPKVRVNEDVLAKIEVGMRKEMVETVIGGPPGDYSEILPKFDRSTAGTSFEPPRHYDAQGKEVPLGPEFDDLKAREKIEIEILFWTQNGNTIVTAYEDNHLVDKLCLKLYLKWQDREACIKLVSKRIGEQLKAQKRWR